MRRGFHGASLDEIAETAGFTRGAIYKNFADKEELFLAVFERVNEQTLDAFAQMLEQGVSSFFDVPALAQMWASIIGDPDLLTLELEFRLYEVRNPSVRERVRGTTAAEPRAGGRVPRGERHRGRARSSRFRPTRWRGSCSRPPTVRARDAGRPDPGRPLREFLELIIPVLFTESHGEGVVAVRAGPVRVCRSPSRTAGRRTAMTRSPTVAMLRIGGFNRVPSDTLIVSQVPSVYAAKDPAPIGATAAPELVVTAEPPYHGTGGSAGVSHPGPSVPFRRLRGGDQQRLLRSQPRVGVLPAAVASPGSSAAITDRRGFVL